MHNSVQILCCTSNFTTLLSGLKILTSSPFNLKWDYFVEDLTLLGVILLPLKIGLNRSYNTFKT